MQQSDFEKRVREKMDELNFTPSPPVWPHIEKQIRQKKERRRLLVWFFLLALVLGGGIWWGVERISDDRQPITERKVTGERMTDNRQPMTEGKMTDDRQPVTGEKIREKVEGPGTDNIVTTDTEEKNTVGKEQIVTGRIEVEKEKVTGGRNRDSRETTAKVPAVNRQRVVNRITEPEVEAALNTGRKNTKPAAEKVKQDKPAADTQAVVMTPPADVPAKPVEVETEKETEKETGTGKTQQEATEPDLSGDTAIAVQNEKEQPQKNSKWTTGISVTVGVSGTGSGLRLFPVALRDNLYSSPQTGSGGNMGPPRPSRVGEGFSFGVGYVVKRNTGRNLSYSTGLRYNYYSTSIAVGTRYDSTISIYNGTGFITANVFYSNPRWNASVATATIYRNQYHFVSLPFDLEIKLGTIPLYASAGLSLQYMIATNALVYNPDSYLYYRQKKALNSFQLFGNAGLHYTFFQNKKTPVQLGPQLSYGLGRLEKDTRSYLFTAGITARMMLGKKRI